MPKLIDLTGQRFHRLVVIEPVRNARGKPSWRCRCDCGGEIVTHRELLVKGRTKSCGCYRVERGREHGATIRLRHGEGRNGKESPEYRAWANMVSRCHNQNHQSFHNDGARGISVCERWRSSFESFLVDVGRRPSPDHSLDRIDNEGHYEPGNVRWATRSEQGSNKRSLPRRLFTIDGETKPLRDWLVQFGVPRALFDSRVRRGWPEREAATTRPGAATWRDGRLLPLIEG